MKGIGEEALKALVREVVARELGRPAVPTAPAVPHAPAAAVVVHASHRQFTALRVAGGDGACLIEPAVACTHCGYCQSYGH
ncbi:MAG: hypothetical protein KGN76_03390 [Acidobacteriota bacterium]|nr:hypothetical protein [Acidobacteriota bacterium]